MENIPLFAGFYTFRMVQDFFHQPYEFGPRCQVELHNSLQSETRDLELKERPWVFSVSIFKKNAPVKFSIDTQNRHVWKEIHFPNHHFWVSMLNFVLIGGNTLDLPRRMPVANEGL